MGDDYDPDKDIYTPRPTDPENPNTEDREERPKN